MRSGARGPHVLPRASREQGNALFWRQRQKEGGVEGGAAQEAPLADKNQIKAAFQGELDVEFGASIHLLLSSSRLLYCRGARWYPPVDTSLYLDR